MNVSTRTLWFGAGIAFVTVVAWAVASRIVPELVLIYSAVVIGEGARPLVELLERRGLPRPVAILIVLVVVLGIISGLGWLLLTPLVGQIASLVDNLPHYLAIIQREVAAYQQFLRNNAQARSLLAQVPERISAFLESKLGLVVQAPLFVFGFFKDAILIIIIAFFWLTASRELAAFTIDLAEPEHRGSIRAILDDLSAKTGGYVRGVLINMAVIGVVSFGGVALLGVPYALLLGVVAALTESIPIVGPLLGGAAAVIVSLVTVGTVKAVEVAALYLIIQQIEGNTLVPFVMNRVVELNPLAIIISLVIGGALLGVPGAILAVPTAAILQVLVLRLVVPVVRRRSLGCTTTVAPSSSDPKRRANP